MTAGDNVIVRKSTANSWTVKDWLGGAELYNKAGSGKWVPEASQFIDKFPHHLLLPKGIFYVYIRYIFKPVDSQWESVIDSTTTQKIATVKNSYAIEFLILNIWVWNALLSGAKSLHLFSGMVELQS